MSHAPGTTLARYTAALLLAVVCLAPGTASAWEVESVNSGSVIRISRGAEDTDTPTVRILVREEWRTPYLNATSVEQDLMPQMVEAYSTEIPPEWQSVDVGIESMYSGVLIDLNGQRWFVNTMGAWADRDLTRPQSVSVSNNALRVYLAGAREGYVDEDGNNTSRYSYFGIDDGDLSYAEVFGSNGSTLTVTSTDTASADSSTTPNALTSDWLRWQATLGLFALFCVALIAGLKLGGA